MEITILASGSEGNSIYLRSGNRALLIDAGLSAAGLRKRMSSAGVPESELEAIVITHEHSDHIKGVRVLSGKLGVPVYANQKTAGAASLGIADSQLIRFRTGEVFCAGGFRLLPFPVPHDASDPVGFQITDGPFRVGIATDLGSITTEVITGLSNCNMVILESNHDREMLLNGPYHPKLKERIDGPFGHLSNEDAASLAASVAHSGLTWLILAHLSHTNNRPSLGVECARIALGSRQNNARVVAGGYDAPLVCSCHPAFLQHKD